MPNWTRFDPGAGDLTACDRARQWGVLVQDGFNVFTIGVPSSLLGGQDLPESFLGSSELEVHAGESQPDGGVAVTYIINNDTAIDSATRIPASLKRAERPS